MKGKSLYDQLVDLNKAERHQIINVCKKSGDKRHACLYQLLKSNFQEKSAFEKELEDISESLFQGDAYEQDKVLRRFIDFSSKEIENQKIKNFLDKNPKERNFILTEVYKKPSTEVLFEKYNQKTQVLSEKVEDVWTQKACVDKNILLKYNTKKKKDFNELKKLLLFKNKLTHSVYHQNLAEVYELYSKLFFDDTNVREEMGQLELSEEDISSLILLAGKSPQAIEYKIAQLRMRFFEDDNLLKDLTELNNLFDEVDADPKIIKRLMAKKLLLTTRYKFSKGVEENDKESTETVKLNEAINFKNDTGVFYYLLYKLFNNPQIDINNEIKKLNLKYFKSDTLYLLEFVFAAQELLNKNYSGAIKWLNNLSYAPNYYISMWSRLMEIKAHYEKDNISFCENLFNRAVRQYQNNTSRKFTQESNAYILAYYAEKLNVKIPTIIKNKTKNNNCLLHKHLLLDD